MPCETRLGGNPSRRPVIEDVQVGPLLPSEVRAAVGVLSRGMRDIPTHLAAFGPDPNYRLRYSRTLFGLIAGAEDFHEHALAARLDDNTLVGVCAMHAPGECRAPAGQQLRMMVRMLLAGPRTTLRTMRWMSIWARHDPPERHWHLGPVAVEPRYQGRGIGTRLMHRFCADVDSAGEDAYLETDMEINVRFYERFGFEVTGRAEVLGTQHWFMFRPARSHGAS